MCGGAVISDFAPSVTRAKGRKLTAEELWTELDASACDDFWGFDSTFKRHSSKRQGTIKLIVLSYNKIMKMRNMNISDESVLYILRIKADPGLKLTKHQNLYTTLIFSKKKNLLLSSLILSKN